MRFKKLVSVLCPEIESKLARTIPDVAGMLVSMRDDDVPLYASGKGGFYLYGVMLPNSCMTGDWRSDVLGWGFSVPEGYGYWYTPGAAARDAFELSPAFDHAGSRVLEQGEAPVFMRSHPKRGSYLDPNQRLLHILNLFPDAKTKTWVRMNNLGEDEVPLRVYDGDNGWLVTLDREALNDYLVVTASSLVRVIDYVRPGLVDFDVEGGDDFVDDALELHLRTRTSSDGTLAAARGFEVLRVAGAHREVSLARLRGETRREYASFVVLDWKNNKVVEWTSDPARLGNYFVPSELPFETSPAFFKAEVLSQYRIEPGRFRVLPDRVQCIGAWSLRYDVNEEGQVHAYIVDLAHIPYQEQLRWKAFNVAPLDTISRRAYERDFEARWFSDYDPLLALKAALQAFPQPADVEGPCIWSIAQASGSRGTDVLGYVHADNPKEFEDQILALSQIVVEGLSASEINKLAEGKSCRDKKLGPLRQLARVLDALGVDQAQRDQIIQPLADVWALRSAAVAHRGGAMPEDFRGRHRELLAQCDVAMRALSALVRTGVFHI